MKWSLSVPATSPHTNVEVKYYYSSLSNIYEAYIYLNQFQCLSLGLRIQSITPAEIPTLPRTFLTKLLFRRTPSVAVLSRCLTWPVQRTLSLIRSWVEVRVVTGIFSRNWETTIAISLVINHQYTETLHSSTGPESKVWEGFFFLFTGDNQ